ncbi:putative protein-serine/threonine kinase [Helianthus anomalus]
MLLQPLFPGENAVDQLVEIIKVQFWAHQLDKKSVALTRTTTISDFRKLRLIHGIRYVFHKRMPPEAIDLASHLLQYSPSLRCNALEAIAHPFFDELRQPNVHLPNGRPLPPLFDFKQEVLYMLVDSLLLLLLLLFIFIFFLAVILAGAYMELINRLIPDYVKKQMNMQVPQGVVGS